MDIENEIENSTTLVLPDPEKMEIVEAPEQLEHRLEEYLRRHFYASVDDRALRRWAKDANSHKAHLAEMLGLPHPNSAICFKSSQPHISDRLKSQLVRMVMCAETRRSTSTSVHHNVATPTSPSWESIDLDMSNLTYADPNGKGKRKKLLRQLRKAPRTDQVDAFRSLCKILNIVVMLPPEGEDGKRPDIPFEKFWPKLGDELKSRPYLMVTPDPLMILGSGLVKNSGSCHRPGGDYQQGPFTYSYDKHTLVAFSFSASDFKRLSEEAIMRPYDDARWLPPAPDFESPCGQAIGRVLYHVHDARSYRIPGENCELPFDPLSNVNFYPDESSRIEGGRLACLVQARTYGVFPDAAKKEVRNLIQKRLREHKGIPPTIWKAGSEADSLSVDAPEITYRDSSHYSVRYIQLDAKNEPQKLSSIELSTITLEEPPCPCCGESLISDCSCIGSALKCSCCDSPLNSEESAYYSPNGDPYCEECFYEAYTYCERCGETVCAEDMAIVENSCGSESWCEGCIATHAVSCGQCSTVQSISVSDMTDVHTTHGGEILMCQDCCDAEGVTDCARCGETYSACGVSEFRDTGEHYCAECLEEEEAENPEEEDEELPENIAVVHSDTTQAAIMTVNEWAQNTLSTNS